MSRSFLGAVVLSWRAGNQLSSYRCFFFSHLCVGVRQRAWESSGSLMMMVRLDGDEERRSGSGPWALGRALFVFGLGLLARALRWAAVRKEGLRVEIRGPSCKEKVIRAGFGKECSDSSILKWDPQWLYIFFSPLSRASCVYHVIHLI